MNFLIFVLVDQLQIAKWYYQPRQEIKLIFDERDKKISRLISLLRGLFHKGMKSYYESTPFSVKNPELPDIPVLSNELNITILMIQQSDIRKIRVQIRKEILLSNTVAFSTVCVGKFEDHCAPHRLGCPTFVRVEKFAEPQGHSDP